jgi:hypothetical protein
LLEHEDDMQKVLDCINGQSTDAMFTHTSPDPTRAGSLVPEAIIICKRFGDEMASFALDGSQSLTGDIVERATDADAFRAAMKAAHPALQQLTQNQDLRNYVPMDFLSENMLDHVIFHEVSSFLFLSPLFINSLRGHRLLTGDTKKLMHTSLGFRADDIEDRGDWEECVEGEKEDDELGELLQNAGESSTHYFHTWQVRVIILTMVACLESLALFALIVDISITYQKQVTWEGYITGFQFQPGVAIQQKKRAKRRLPFKALARGSVRA